MTTDILATDRVGPTGILSEEEVREISAGLSHYEDNQALCIDALKVVQKHRGWVSDDCLQAIADYLKLSSADVEGVATFYNLIYRQPVGKQVVRVCDSVTCWIMGYDKLREQFKSALSIDLGQTTADGQFTLLPGPCMGACDRAPVVMVNHDLHGNVDISEGAQQIIDQYRK